MKLDESLGIANKYVSYLEPFCKRIQIAGSIRREKEEIKDIEIVCTLDNLNEFSEMVNRWKKIKGEPIGKYTQRELPEGIKLDLFMSQVENWGNILLIRTGNWQFSKYIVGTKAKQAGLIQKDGFLWRGDEKINCLEEKDVFDLLKIDYIEPKDRDKEIYNF